MTSIKFYLAQASSAAIAFLALPILTRIYAPDVYGQYLLILSAVVFINTVFTYGLYQGTLRFVPGADAPAAVARQVENGTAIILFVLMLLLVGAGCIGLATGQYPTALLRIGLLTGLWIVLLALGTLQSVLRYAQGHGGRYALFMLAQNGVPPLLALLLSWWVGASLTVLLLSQCLALALAWAAVARPIPLTRPDRGLLGHFVRYGAPLTVWTICAQVLNSLDRFMLARMVGIDAAGIYATNYNLIISVQSLAFGPLLLAVHPQLMRLWNQRDPAYGRVLQEAVEIFALLAALSLGIFWACHGTITSLLFGAEFRSASHLMPLIALGHILWGLAAYLGKGFEFQRQTERMALFTLIAVGVNGGLNWLTLGRYGMEAAAYTTLVAYALYTLLVYIYTERRTREVLYHHSFLCMACIPLAMWLVSRWVQGALHRPALEAALYAAATGGALALTILLSRVERRVQLRAIFQRAQRAMGIPSVTLLLGLVLASGGLLMPAAGAMAQAAPPAQSEIVPQGVPPVSLVEQFDLDGDERPNLTVLHTEILFPGDQVRVYDGGDNMPVSAQWQEATDFWDDTWVFDVRGDGNAQFVAQFMPVANGFSAHLYMDENRNGVVSMEVDDRGRVQVTESPTPSIIITVQGDWYLPDGQLNWNVRFQVDGSIRHIYTYNLTEVWEAGNYFRHDGTPDTELKFSDEDQDGIPEMGIWRVLAPTPSSRGSMRTWIWSNEGRHVPEQPEDVVFFPFFSAQNFEDTVVGGRASVSGHNYFDTPPLISMAFDSARVRYLYFPGYPIEEGYHVHSLNYFYDDEVNYANFENEQAYYDLAEDSDGIPELHVRHRYYAPGDPYGWNLDTPVDEIRWSWNQENVDELAFTHKVSLAGRNEITTTVQLGDVRYKTVPYDQLPDWVLNRPWDIGLLVVNETFPLRSTEGIYDWNAVEQVYDGDASLLSRYLAGDVTLDPSDAFTVLDPGWRGDIAPRLDGLPTLYFSPIDGKLHLRGAKSGFWQIDPSTQLHYGDADEDGYLDSWQLYEDGELVQQLYLAGGELIVADGERILVRPYDGPLSHFEVLPPRTNAERVALAEQLAAHAPEDDLLTPAAMFAAQGNAVSTMEGATIRSFRSGGSASSSEPNPLENGANGFYLVVETSEESWVRGVDRLAVADLAPGRYSVTYHPTIDRYTAEPALLQLALNLEITPVDGVTQGLRVTVENQGNEDAGDLVLVGEARQGNRTQEVWREPLAAAAGESTRRMQRWQPPAGGQWTLDLRVEDAAGISPNITLAETQRSIEVEVAEVGLGAGGLTVGGPQARLLYRALWGVLALVIGWALYLALSPRRVSESA